MSKFFKIIGITDYAERHLCVEDTERLIEVIGCEVEESEYLSFVDGEKMVIMPDGEEVHVAFLNLEEIQD